MVKLRKITKLYKLIFLLYSNIHVCELYDRIDMAKAKISAELKISTDSGGSRKKTTIQLLNRAEKVWFSQYLFSLVPLLYKHNYTFVMEGLPALSFTGYYGITVIIIFIYNEYLNRLKNNIKGLTDNNTKDAKELASDIIKITRIFTISSLLWLSLWFALENELISFYIVYLSYQYKFHIIYILYFILYHCVPLYKYRDNMDLMNTLRSAFGGYIWFSLDIDLMNSLGVIWAIDFGYGLAIGQSEEIIEGFNWERVNYIFNILSMYSKILDKSKNFINSVDMIYALFVFAFILMIIFDNFTYPLVDDGMFSAMKALKNTSEDMSKEEREAIEGLVKQVKKEFMIDAKKSQGRLAKLAKIPFGTYRYFTSEELNRLDELKADGHDPVIIDIIKRQLSRNIPRIESLLLEYDRDHKIADNINKQEIKAAFNEFIDAKNLLIEEINRPSPETSAKIRSFLSKFLKSHSIDDIVSFTKYLDIGDCRDILTQPWAKSSDLDSLFDEIDTDEAEKYICSMQESMSAFRDTVSDLSKKLNKLTRKNKELKLYILRYSDSQKTHSLYAKVSSFFSGRSDEIDIVSSYEEFYKISDETKKLIRSTLSNASESSDAQIQSLLKKLEKKISKHDHPVLRYISKYMKGSPIHLQSKQNLCFIGAPGTGKTYLMECVAKTLAGPEQKPIMITISCSSIGGGCSTSGGVDALSLRLNGTDHVFVGSDPGLLVTQLIHIGVKNPICFIDEIDKVSNYVLFLDFLTNCQINSRYFDFPISLGKILIVFAANSALPIQIDVAFHNRLRIINVDEWDKDKKIKVLYQIIDEKLSCATRVLAEEYENICTILKDCVCEAIIEKVNEKGIRQAKDLIVSCMDIMVANHTYLEYDYDTQQYQFDQCLINIGVFNKQEISDLMEKIESYILSMKEIYIG